MKKTLTVNLGGTVYNVDEDAYFLLDNYLNNLRYHFRKNPEGEEIVRDMEVRIAELFNEYLREGGQVVTVENVEAVISRMGKPEDLNDGEEDTSAGASAPEEKSEVRRRLFRNPDDRVLGGVASGIAAYFGWDVVALRLLFIVSGVFVHWLLLAYLIAWIIIPVARTATEKLQMRGEPINMENIGRTVTSGFEGKDSTEASQSVWRKAGDVIVKIIGFILKLCLILLAICCFPVLFVTLIVAFALLLAAVGILVSVPSLFYEFSPVIDWSMVSAFPVTSGVMAVCCLLAVGIPIAGLIQLLMQVFGNWNPMSTVAKLVLILVWIMAVIVGTIVFFDSPFAGSVML